MLSAECRSSLFLVLQLPDWGLTGTISFGMTQAVLLGAYSSPLGEAHILGAGLCLYTWLTATCMLL